MRRRALRCLASSSSSCCSSSSLLLSLLGASVRDRLGARSAAATGPIARNLWSTCEMAAAAVAVTKAPAAAAAAATTALRRAANTTTPTLLLLSRASAARPSLLLSRRPLSTTAPAPRAADSDAPPAPAKPLPPQRHLPELPQLPAPVTLRPLSRADVAVAFSRSSGAGGQNVNKVSTKVDMRWDVGAADWVPEEVKGALRVMEKNRFTGGRAKANSGGGGSEDDEGGGGGGSGGGGGPSSSSSSSAVIVVSASRHRTQRANLDDALEKLQVMLDAAVAAVTPRESDPEAVKRVAKAVKAGNEKRLDAKKKDAKKKSERRRKGDWD